MRHHISAIQLGIQYSGKELLANNLSSSNVCYNCKKSYQSVQTPAGKPFAANETKRCSACDSLFPSLMALEHHKEEFEHWSGDDSPPDNSESEEDTSDDTVTSEELERLL
ncbi:Uncharacterized protein GBIM_20787 [Gryllus bimaculatus]|nr:Uncharacterized protein GBIM_20787 [Gryllus bimaculatus]